MYANETTLAAYAFWVCHHDLHPETVLDALAWRRHQTQARCYAYVAATETEVVIGKAATETLRQLPNKWSLYAPPDARAKMMLTFGDDQANELVRYLRRVFRPHRISGSWYRRAQLQPWIDRVAAREPPPYAPAVLTFESEDRWRQLTGYQRQELQRAEAVATYRQMLESGPVLPAHRPEPPKPVEPGTCPIVNPEALVGPGTGLSRAALGSSKRIASIPTAPWPEDARCSWCGEQHAGGPEHCTS